MIDHRTRIDIQGMSHDWLSMLRRWFEYTGPGSRPQGIHLSISKDPFAENNWGTINLYLASSFIQISYEPSNWLLGALNFVGMESTIAD